jgi:hypothetical protein
MKMRKFEDFPTGNESGRLIVNPFWLEHILNLFSQGYLGEIWEEIMDTKIQKDEMIENVGYGVINLALGSYNSTEAEHE